MFIPACHNVIIEAETAKAEWPRKTFPDVKIFSVGEGGELLAQYGAKGTIGIYQPALLFKCEAEEEMGHDGQVLGLPTEHRLQPIRGSETMIN